MDTEESISSLLPPVVSQPDWFLQTLVNMSNQSGIEIGITLQVSGMLVSGVMVNGAKYFEGFGEEFSQIVTGDSEAAALIKTSFASYGDIYQKKDDDLPLSPPQFIHLKNARFFNTAGNPIPGNRGVWWRGRIFEVGGFSLGTLSTSNI